MATTEEWLTVEEAAELSGYHANHIRRIIRKGYLKAQKRSFIWFVSRQSLLDYIAQGEATGDERRGPK